jgi:hypothetical protein
MTVTELRKAAKPEAPVDPLALLREPFPAHQISKLPKPLAKREEMDKLPKAKCAECGGYHATSKILHLDYVGHAAATDRLLDADPRWSWAPVADPVSKGLPMAPGGMWIELTVHGVTRLGFGDAGGKTGGDAVKEVIGDAIRNAGMRFGMALDLWHKGDLHADDEPTLTADELAIQHLRSCSIDGPTFKGAWTKNKDGWKGVMDQEAYGRVVAEMKRLAFQIGEKAKAAEPHPAPAPADDFGIGEDEIPF